MDKLPSYAEVRAFFKNNLKTISFTILFMGLFYGLAVSYTIFTNNQIEELSDELPDNADGQDAGELLKSHSRAVYMTFFIENNNDGVFTNFRLLNEVLTNQAYLKDFRMYSEIDKLEELGYDITDIISLTFDNTNNTHVLTVSTGVLSNNFSIINDIEKSLLTKEITLLKDKEVFVISDPKRVETAEEKKIITNVDEPGLEQYLIIAAVLLVTSFFLGIVVAIVKTYMTKEITEFYTVKFNEDDKVINLSLIKNTEIKEQQLNHTIKHPYELKKLVLSENVGQFISVNHEHIEYSEDILKTSPKDHFDEVILILQKNVTKKEWYRLQKTQLENYTAAIKIILI